MLGARHSCLQRPALCACALLALGRRSGFRTNGRSQPQRVLHDPGEHQFRRHLGARRQKHATSASPASKLHLKTLLTAAQQAPRGTVNGNDAAGFNLYRRSSRSRRIASIIVGQTPIALAAGEEQGAFYGVGQFTNGSPDYPGKPVGTNFDRPILHFAHRADRNPLGHRRCLRRSAVGHGRASWQRHIRRQTLRPASQAGSSGQCLHYVRHRRRRSATSRLRRRPPRRPHEFIALGRLQRQRHRRRRRLRDLAQSERHFVPTALAPMATATES